jgi:hypothetical protein
MGEEPLAVDEGALLAVEVAVEALLFAALFDDELHAAASRQTTPVIATL